MPGSDNADKYLILLEDMNAKIELLAEGHLQLVDGQKRIEKKLDINMDSLRTDLTAMEFRLSRRIDHISSHVDCLEHSRS